jgi:hypothetical protein
VVEAHVTDMSPAGAGLICGLNMQTGKKFMLHVDQPRKKRPFIRMCTVTNCRSLGMGKYRVGVKFLLPEPGQKKKLIDRLIKRGSGSAIPTT